jgi:hypothetical protein
MDYKTIVIWMCFPLILSGCATLKDVIPLWQTHGIKQLDEPETVWKEYNCQDENLPLVKIESNELSPARLKPKKKMECNHRFTYGLCSEIQSRIIFGQLHTRIYHRGKMIIDDVAENYSLQPGRWRVDTLIVVPKHAEPGVYTLETEFVAPDSEFSGRPAEFKINNTFIVEPEEE